MKFPLLFMLVSLISLQSCESDLDIKPEAGNVFLSDEFFAQPNAYQNAIAGVYANLALTGTEGPGSSNIGGLDAGTSQYGRCLWYMQELVTDEAIWSYEGDGGVRDLQRNVWVSDNPIIRGIFSRAHFQVAICNEFLRQSTPSLVASRNVANPAVIEEYRQEVRVLRALAYYHMMDLFGKAVFTDETFSVVQAGEEYNRQQLFEYIESELLEVLPSLKAPRTNQEGRLDAAMARMILAKMYLNAEVYIGQPKYNECVTQLDAIIAGGYQLAPNYLLNFSADNNTSPEMIFAIQSDGRFTQNFGPTTVMINGSVGSIEQNGANLGVSAGGWGGALRLREQFVSKFDGTAFSNDARNTIISGVRDRVITDVANRDQGFILAKYSNKSSTGAAGTNPTFVDTDFPLFRLGDAYLMYAECFLRGASNANQANALGYVNALRERANGDSSQNITANQLTLDFILDERARELHWEAHRRQDLIRFGRFTGGTYNWAWKGNAQNGVAIGAFRAVYPVPILAISANPNLTQNPGY
ncbi:RagB/SusD family nutrient uptake outer membrane protein [Flavobacterium sp.]|uniref:RagB/SusD family nutrient uptake outer membrane protein n=1 Tax=Flavobacterium sp. TaxID=239 RepID=UPI0034225F0F